MDTVLVWVLISIGGSVNSEVTYSPPVADLESCQRLQKEVEKWARRTRCIQIRIPKQ
jgi:hypothetical protein